MKIAAIVAFSLLLIGRASADEKTDAMSAYVLCARHMAVKFEPSGESPESIASAAVWACTAEGAKAFNSLLSDPLNTPQQLVESAKLSAVGQVVGVRLCKKTKDCSYARVP